MMNKDNDKILNDIKEMNKLSKDIIKYTNKDYHSYFDDN